MPRRDEAVNEPRSKNITWHGAEISRRDREEALGQRGCVVWLTGLSGSGKSTVARAVEARLLANSCPTYVLDGDNLRHGLNADLGFSEEDRQENIRRVGEVAALFADAGLIVLVSFISPFRSDRDRARAVAPEGCFYEVYLDVSLAECERRDPKGLYKKARAGEIREFTGIDSPYEAPKNAELVLRTEDNSVDDCADAVLALLARHQIAAIGGEEDVEP